MLNSLLETCVWIESLYKHHPKHNIGFVQGHIPEWLVIVCFIDTQPLIEQLERNVERA